MDALKSLPARIRQARLRLGLSQENLAEELGISTTAYGDLERGRTEITLSKLTAIAEALQLTVPELLELPGEVIPELDWLRTENQRLVAENTALRLQLEEMEAKINILFAERPKALDTERTRIGF